MTHADALRAELSRAARTLGAPDDVSPILERPRDPSFGDWATNLAMTLAKPLGKKPRDIAEALIAALDMPRVGIVSAEIAGPGFVNIRLDPGFQARGLLQEEALEGRPCPPQELCCLQRCCLCSSAWGEGGAAGQQPWPEQCSAASSSCCALLLLLPPWQIPGRPAQLLHTAGCL